MDKTPRAPQHLGVDIGTSPSISALTLTIGDRTVLAFRSDGTAWADPDLDPSETAQAIIKALLEQWPIATRATALALGSAAGRAEQIAQGISEGWARNPKSLACGGAIAASQAGFEIARMLRGEAANHIPARDPKGSAGG